MDHIITRDLKDQGLDGERVALVIKDVYSKFRYIYPAEAKDTESCINSSKHFLKVEDKIGTIYSDNAPERIAAARNLKARLVTSRAYVKLWPLAAQHQAIALNLTEKFDSKSIPWEDRFGEGFDGLMVPFGAKVLYWNNQSRMSLVSPSSQLREWTESFLGTTFSLDSVGERSSWSHL